MEADVLLLSNTTDLQYAEKICVKGRPLVFRNGITTDVLKISPQLNIIPRILFLGTWIERKGIRLLREAYQSIKRRGLSMVWRFAGIGIAESALRQYLGAGDDLEVEVIPSFKASEEGAIFRDCDIFVLPSFSEGQSLALLEGLGRGLCCITTDADGQRDLIRHRQNGLLFPVGNSELFTNLLVEAVMDRDLRTRLGSMASERVRDRSWLRVTDEVVDFVLGSLRGGR